MVLQNLALPSSQHLSRFFELLSVNDDENPQLSWRFLFPILADLHTLPPRSKKDHEITATVCI